MCPCRLRQGRRTGKSSPGSVLWTMPSTWQGEETKRLEQPRFLCYSFCRTHSQYSLPISTRHYTQQNRHRVSYSFGIHFIAMIFFLYTSDDFPAQFLLGLFPVHLSFCPKSSTSLVLSEVVHLSRSVRSRPPLSFCPKSSTSLVLSEVVHFSRSVRTRPPLSFCPNHIRCLGLRRVSLWLFLISLSTLLWLRYWWWWWWWLLLHCFCYCRCCCSYFCRQYYLYLFIH